MNIEIQQGDLKTSDVAWGHDAAGNVLHQIRSPQFCIRLTMTPKEAIDMGNAAIFLGMGARKAPAPSSLFAPDGGPLPSSGH